MFGKSKSAKVEEPRAFGWKINHLEAFADKLAGKRPLIQTTIAGIRHSFRIDGESYGGAVARARAEQETYRSMPLLFDAPPLDESFCRLVTDEYELAGTLRWPPAVVRGNIGLSSNPSEISDNGIIGHLSITCRDSGTERAVQPLINFHFDFYDSEDLERASKSMQTSLSANGMAWANFLVKPIDNRDDWIAYFVKNGYCPGLDIMAVYLGTSAGNMLED